ncbi:MAG: tRNA (adenosine(37)-N6)-threonylcarbamoyltransferase complex dimerization subunit type 1 TsaB [Gelidibacter sp.]|nr:tRNA (adenosine(37)-N6)-threonylcarbamoyltransferase complex dimerization subunit type 1 TsaB [Gelidibacter sp.]
MSYILSIETATTNCSVALSKGGETLVLKEDNNTNYSHAESLHVFIETVLKSANLQPSQLDAIAVSKGPGSYTGLRIGVSAAKGLCFSLDKPLISVNTLQALAHQISIKQGVIVAMLDARRMEVYASVYDANHQQIRGIEAQILDEKAFETYLEAGKVYFIGNAVEKTKEIIKHPNAIYMDDTLPSANEMSKLAFEKYKKNDIEDVAYFEPFYLKDFMSSKA